MQPRLIPSFVYLISQYDCRIQYSAFLAVIGSDHQYSRQSRVRHRDSDIDCGFADGYAVPSDWRGVSVLEPDSAPCHFDHRHELGSRRCRLAKQRHMCCLSVREISRRSVEIVHYIGLIARFYSSPAVVLHVLHNLRAARPDNSASFLRPWPPSNFGVPVVCRYPLDPQHRPSVSPIQQTETNTLRTIYLEMRPD